MMKYEFVKFVFLSFFDLQGIFHYSCYERRFQLNPTEANNGSRPSLKLKIHLNAMNILNRKNRLLGLLKYT